MGRVAIRKKTSLFFFLFVLSCGMLSASAVAWGAQDSTIIEDNAPVRAEPAANAKVIDFLPVGMEVRVSSYPLPGGWYKVRARNGMYGWIAEQYVSVQKADETEKPHVEVIEGPRPERDRKWYLRVVGGYDFFRPQDLNDAFHFNDLNTGYTVGGELGYFISERVAVLLRSEALIKDVVANESISRVTYNLGIRSYPIMGGFDFYFAKEAAFRFSLGVLAGVAASTTFTAEAINLSSPNIVVLSSNPFTTYVRANATRPLGRVVSIFAELGYRYLSSPAISTVNSSNGGGVWVVDNSFKARQIDLSGVVLAAGLGLHF